MTNEANNISAVSSATELCSIDDLVPNAGVCALIGERQIAVFYLPDLPDASQQVFALDNFDPIGKASVLSRGITGDIDGRLVVASPLYKQHFDLCSGVCVEDASISVQTWPVEVVGDKVVLHNVGGD